MNLFRIYVDLIFDDFCDADKVVRGEDGAGVDLIRDQMDVLCVDEV